MTDEQHAEAPYCMSKKHTDCMRFILVIIVILYHQTLNTDYKIFPVEGDYAVFMFFLISGYGLYVSQKNKESYLKKFLPKRFVGLLVRYWYVSLIVLLITSILYSSVPDAGKIAEVFISWPHWYITQLLTFYLIFFVVFYILNKKGDMYCILGMCLLVPIAMVLEYNAFDTDLYIKTGLGFVMGFFVAKFGDRLFSMEETTNMIAAILLTAILCMNDRMPWTMSTFIMPFVFALDVLFLSTIERRYAPVLIMVLGIVLYGLGMITAGAALMCAGFSMIPLISEKLDSVSKLGRFSLEMYLIHFHFLIYLIGVPHITDPVQLFLFTLALTMLVAVPANLIISWILKKYDARIDRVFDKSRKSQSSEC